MNIYLAGEIHTDWRDEIMNGCKEKGLDFNFTSPQLNHDLSDTVGSQILGDEPDMFWRDRKSANINAIRTRNAIGSADVVIVRFGEKYKQWNAAFDAGYAAALNIPLIILHQEEHNHPLKEVDAAAQAVARTPQQVVEILDYITRS